MVSREDAGNWSQVRRDVSAEGGACPAALPQRAALSFIHPRTGASSSGAAGTPTAPLHRLARITVTRLSGRPASLSGKSRTVPACRASAAGGRDGRAGAAPTPGPPSTLASPSGSAAELRLRSVGPHHSGAPRIGCVDLFHGKISRSGYLRGFVSLFAVKQACG